MAKTANPAVIIGLGGTGQWALTYVKKNLVDTYGEVPKTIQLLAFDTTSEESEAAVEAGQSEERAQVGNVTLDPGEFIFLGGNIRRICKEIRDENQHRHIGSWLQAGYYLRAHDDDAYTISKGAGRRRPFGRMAVFYDLSTGQPQIMGKINQAITNVKSASERTRPIEIYIICSLAGGTGSGMFIDIAHLARVLAARAQIDFAIRGFVVMQNTFLPVTEIRDVQPKTFAALRELERFMLVFDRDYPIYYTDDPSKRALQTVYRSKLFDNCYLLDARRTNLPLDGIPPKLGVFPAVAECITVLLDPETGNTFDQHYKNVNERLAHAQQEENKALYSSLGTFTYILPVEDIIERNTLKLAVNLVRDRLVGIHHDLETGVIQPTSERVTEFQTLPRDEALAFLRMETSSSNVQNAPICQNVALALQEPLDRQDVVEDMAGRGVELLSWLKPVEQDDAVIQTGQRIETVLQTSMITEVPNAKVTGEDFVTAADRIDRTIREIRKRLLGQEEESGRRTPGEFQTGLDDYARRNQARFRRLLTEKLLLILNGATDDQITAKTGKLPYAQEFLHLLSRGFEEFEEFMARVAKARDQRADLAQARDWAIQTRQTMYDSVHETGIIARLKNTAVDAQDSYIENEDYLFDLERQDLLYRALISLTRSLKEITQQAQTEVDEWLAILALGGSPESGEKGVYKALLDKQTELKRRRDEQKHICVYEYMTDDAFEDQLYASRIDEKKLGEILRRFRWDLTGEDGFNLHLFYSLARRASVEDEPELLKKPRRREQPATDTNVRLLMDHLRPHFYDIRDETVADRMEETLTAARSAKKLLDSAGAMISYSPNRQGHLEKHNLVCANRGVQVNYFEELESELKKSAPNDKDNQVIGLSNKHRSTILSTVDLLIGQYTGPYETASQVYQTHAGDRKLLHNFPAEVNACEFEDKLTQPPLSEQRRLLSPELVALLEDREMPRRFVLALVYGLIREEEVRSDSVSDEGSRRNQYTLHLDTVNARQRRSDPWRIRLIAPSERPRLLDAMTNFVFVHLDPERGIRAIKDVTPGTNILVEPGRVDQAISQREDSLISGREQVVQDFAVRLKARHADVLTPDGSRLLRSAFRCFLAENERPLRRGEIDLVRERLDALVRDNRDCYESGYADELISSFSEFIEEYAGGSRIVAGDYDRLISKLEGYIDNQVQRMRKDRDQLTHDLGSIMYLILWDEIERLERLRDQEWSGVTD